MENKQYYIDVALRAAQRAANKVAEKACKENRPLPVWKNGRVEFEIPPCPEENSEIDLKNF